eukprot:1936553-Rhodomonas_salina.1
MWRNDTIVQAKVAFSNIVHVEVVLTVQQQRSSVVDVMSFDQPNLQQLFPPNAPAAGGGPVMILGVGLGMSDTSPVASFGSTSASATIWLSGSSLKCLIRSGIGTNLEMMLDAAKNRVGFQFSFDSPYLAPNTVKNLPTTGGRQVVLEGFNFGSLDYSSVIALGHTECGKSTWTSDSSMLCVDSPTGTGRVVVRLVQEQRQQESNQIINFDAPSASKLSLSNGPFAQHSWVTVSGKSYGLSRFSIGSRLGFSACAATQWASDSSMAVNTPTGILAGRSLVATVNVQHATFHSVYSFDLHQLSDLSENVPVTKRFDAVAFFGTGFGLSDTSLAIRIGGSSAEGTLWVAGTSLTCAPSVGILRRPQLTLSVVQAVSTASHIVTYDRVSLSVMTRQNNPTADSHVEVIFGHGIATFDLSTTSKVGFTGAEMTLWFSDTSVHAAVPTGSGEQNSISLTTAASVSSVSHVLSYNTPQVKSLQEGALAVQDLVGSGFGLMDTSVKSRIGFTSCEVSQWTAESSVSCLHSAGALGGHDLVVTMQLQMATRTAAFTYEPAQIRFEAASSTDSFIELGQSDFLLSGRRFGDRDYSPEVRMQLSSCEVTMWHSDREVSCKVAAGVGVLSFVQATVLNHVGTSSSVISFKGPVLDVSGKLNQPASDALFVFHGRLFGRYDSTLSSHIGMTACGGSVWRSDTALQCLTRQGAPTLNAIDVLVAGQMSAMSSAASFDRAVLLSSTSLNLHGLQSNQITATGSNFASVDNSLSVRVGGTSSESTVWSSDSTVLVAVSRGHGSQLTATLTMHVPSGSVSSLMSYDGANPLEENPSVISTTQETKISIIGSNFGSLDYSLLVLIGSTPCHRQSWISESALTCVASIGIGTVRLRIGNSVHFKTIPYSRILVSDLKYLATSSIIEVNGDHYGFFDSSPGSRVGGTAALTTFWVSMSTVRCLVSPSAVRSMAFVVSVGLQAFTALDTISFDNPGVQMSSNLAVHLEQNRSTLVFGSKFGFHDSSPRFRVGFSGSAATQWASDSSMQLRASLSNTKQSLATIVTAALRVASRLESHSYDILLLSSQVHQNSPPGGGSTAFIYGAISAISTSVSARIGETSCVSTQWLAASSVLCFLSRGLGHSSRLRVTTAEIIGTSTSFHSYDTVLLRNMHSADNVPATGKEVLVSGSSVGLMDASSSSKIGFTSASRTSWVSDSSVQSLTAPGMLERLPSILTISESVGSLSLAWTYDAP